MERINTTLVGLPGRNVAEDHVLFSEAASFGDVESPLNFLIETIPHAIFISERLQKPEDWRLVAINSLHHTLTGLGSQQGGLYSDWCPPEQRNYIFSNYDFALSEWGQVSYEEELELPAGRKWWSTTLMPLKTPSGRFRILGSSQDISHTKHTETALSTFLPICSVCKSVKAIAGDDDKRANWIPIETYLSEKKLSHGYCPVCFDRLYGYLKFDIY